MKEYFDLFINGCLGSVLTPMANNPYLIICIFIVVMLICYFTYHKKSGYSSLFTMIGMLGTFLGIVAGLWTFDSSDMDSSIITLLDGMKVAFITSIVGIILSIFYSQKQNKLSEEVDTTTTDGILYSMNELAKKNYELSNQLLETNKLILKSLGGESESSLVSQIKLLKSDMNDNHKKTEVLLKEFSENLAESSTEAIVDALNDVVKNFNEKITDQFGEHFKELNSAVKELVVWQEEYKTYLEAFKQDLELADKTIAKNLENINATITHIERVEQSSQGIPQNLEKLENIIEIQSNELQQLVENLQSFNQIRDNASKVLPEIQTYLNTMSDELGKNIANVTNELQRSITENTKQISDSLETSISTSKIEKEKYISSFETVQQKLESEITNITKTLTKTITDNSKEVTDSLATSIKNSEAEKEKYLDSFAKMQQNLDKELTRTTQNIENMMKEVFTVSDESLKKQVATIIEQMGSELTSISKHLATDYKTFSDQLKKLHSTPWE